MFIYRCLHALLWGALALAGTQGPFLSAPHGGLNIRSRSDHVLRQPDAPRDAPRRGKTRAQARLGNGWIPRLRPRQEAQCPGSTSCSDGGGSSQCCGPGFECCVAEDGAGLCCRGECEGEECASDSVSLEAEVGAPMVTLTTTVVRTVTAGTSTRTEVAVDTASLTLTFIDLGLRTQTDTVSVTAAPQDSRRARQVAFETGAEGVSGSGEAQATGATEVGAQGEGVASAAATAGAGSEAEAGTATTFTAVELTTTVVGVVTVTSTVFHTVFVTLTLAPSATRTVVVTTTAQPTQDSSSSLPSGGTLSEDENHRSLRPVPPGLTDVVSSETPTANSPQSMRPVSGPSSTPDGPQRPIEGSDLTADEIAGIALGLIFGVLFLVLAGFLTYRLVAKRRAAPLARSHRDMSSTPGSESELAAGSGSVPGAETLASTSRTNLAPAATPATPSPGADTLPSSDDVRIVIRPAPKRQTQSSGILPESKYRASSSNETEGVATRGQWPRPPGYKGRPYSFFAEESRNGSVPAVDEGWSERSEDGSREGSVRVAGGGSENGSDTGAESGGGLLSVGRALSPWKVV